MTFGKSGQSLVQTSEVQLPRIFQANIARLFERVVKPGMALLPVHSELALGEAQSKNQFLDRAAAQVDNYTANEAAKAYALTLSAVFERQLSVWARAIVASAAAAPTKAPRYQELLKRCADYGKIDLQGLGLAHDLDELLLVGNVVRHGEGDSCERLRQFSPGLWKYEISQYIDIVVEKPSMSEKMRIQMEDLVRYIRATTLFWGHADPLPLAATSVPY